MKCEGCGVEFEPGRRPQRYHDERCRRAAKCRRVRAAAMAAREAMAAPTLRPKDADAVVGRYLAAAPGSAARREAGERIAARCREVGAVTARGRVFTWDHANGRLRERFRASPSHADAAAPPAPKRQYRLSPDLAAMFKVGTPVAAFEWEPEEATA